MIFSRFKWNADTVLELSEAKSAYVYYRHRRENLLTGFPETYSIDSFVKELDQFKLSDRVKGPRVYHFYYEYGLFQAGLPVSEDLPLVVMIEYNKSKKTKVRKTKLTSLPLKTLERPSWSEYKENFAKVREELLDGNCYQMNLTYPFDFETEEQIDPRDIVDTFFSFKGLGAFAHATFMGEELILSNSPECLFQYKDQKIFTMPIKGTMRRGKSWKSEWKKMMDSPKEEGELLMITDLLKNDLNRLSQGRAVVKKLRSPLLVPGLLHQYSLISATLSKDVSVGETFKSLFPGGSITGAPKIRVMEIIASLERFNRGIYCGSTLLCYGDKKVASINIRTASVSPFERMWRYGAGGGITLLSNPVEEFKEMESKVASFLTSIKAPGY